MRHGSSLYFLDILQYVKYNKAYQLREDKREKQPWESSDCLQYHLDTQCATPCRGEAFPVSGRDHSLAFSMNASPVHRFRSKELHIRHVSETSLHFLLSEDFDRLNPAEGKEGKKGRFFLPFLLPSFPYAKCQHIFSEI